ncbi:hypothetical protein [Thaumasiovibrio subtropicus]|uniref:hypothetical protein n=1 Tax=Thaumasiovibrio subtropicus TaxID=1891207 RepID=UPI00131B3A52|nr:hypothetical protein [Thaumasiovibrio subtropicus]
MMEFHDLSIMSDVESEIAALKSQMKQREAQLAIDTENVTLRRLLDADIRELAALKQEQAEYRHVITNYRSGRNGWLKQQSLPDESLATQQP